MGTINIETKPQFEGAPAWPENRAPAAVGSVAGHNKPPVAIIAQSEFDEQIDQHDGLRKRIADLVGASERATATSEETMGRCGQTIIQIRAAMKLVVDAHTTAKAPYLEGGRVIDSAKNDLHGALAVAKERIEGKQTTYLRDQKRKDDERRAKQEAEKRRIRDENERIQLKHDEAVRKAQAEAERAAQEAAEQGKPIEQVYVAPVIAAPVYIAPPPPKEIERGIIRGAEGAAVSGKKIAKAEINDYAAAFPMLQSDQKVREAMDAAASRLAKAGIREIHGVRIWEDVGVSNR